MKRKSNRGKVWNPRGTSGQVRCHCGCPAVLRSAEGICRTYRPGAEVYVCSGYPACDSFVMAHPGTLEPMGTLAPPGLRRLRYEAHQQFDQLHKSGLMTRRCVHTLDKGCIYTYDDLFQIGCIGLCKAAQTDQPGHKGAFSTYAYCLIRNEIYTQMEYATRRGREQATDPAELPCGVVDDSLEERDACRELMGLLDRAEATATGTTANHVTAWVSKARNHIRMMGQPSV